MDGIIIIDKPLGYTSRDIVNIVAKKINSKKVGHTGTLDPNASGVMILCVGKALKMCELLVNHYKEYEATVILGISSDTLDLDSNATILEDTYVNLSDDNIIEAVNSFKGKYLQAVPMYSSVKVNGKKLYEYARNNISVTVPKKEVDIEDIKVIGDILHIDGKIEFTIRTTVSRGTYIRSLVRDIGNKLGVPAVTKKLKRLKLGSFSIDMANSLEDIKNGSFTLYKITDIFNNIPIIKVDDDIAFKIKNGVSIENLSKFQLTFIVDKNDNLLALYKKVDNVNRPYKMFV